ESLRAAYESPIEIKTSKGGSAFTLSPFMSPANHTPARKPQLSSSRRPQNDKSRNNLSGTPTSSAAALSAPSTLLSPLSMSPLVTSISVNRDNARTQTTPV